MPIIIRFLLISGGILSVSLGVLGIFLPVLPTTPFLLLAAFLFARSSDRLSRWLAQHRWFGPYLRGYHDGRGMPARDKFFTLAVLWLGIGLSAIFVVDVWWGRLLMILVALGVTIYLLRIKARR